MQISTKLFIIMRKLIQAVGFFYFLVKGTYLTLFSILIWNKIRKFRAERKRVWTSPSVKETPR